MNVMRPMLLVVACAAGTLAFGQSAPPGKASGQQTPPPPPTIASVVDRQVSTLEKEIVDAAEAMPEDKFNFAPGSLDIKGSEYKGVRTFAEQVKHVATANFIFWSSIVGEKAPMDPKAIDALKTKAEIVKALKDSYVLGHRAANTLTAENVVEQVQVGERGKAARLYLATFGVAHGFDHYGQMVEYLRMNGIVPPA